MICNMFKNFEREGLDFPFYKDNTKLSRIGLVLLSTIVTLTVINILNPQLDILFTIILALTFITIPIISRMKMDLIFKKLIPEDIFIIIAVVLMSIGITSILSSILICGGLFSPNNPPSYGILNDIIELIYYLVYEELHKFCIFIFGLSVVYKLINDRRVAVIFAAFLTMLLFGSYHYTGEGRLISFIVVQGFGSIFDILAYIKTKNVLVSYLTHLLYDIFCSIPI